MTEQRAVGLAHLPAHALALGIVGLGQVDGDQAAVVAGQHRFGRRAVRRRRPESRTPGRARDPRAWSGSGSRSLQQRVEQPVLGELRSCASSPGSRAGTGPGSSGCGGRPRRTARGCPPKPASCRRRAARWRNSDSGRRRSASARKPPLAFLQRADRLVGRQIAEAAAAALAAGVLKIERLPAMLAFKELHGDQPPQDLQLSAQVRRYQTRNPIRMAFGWRRCRNASVADSVPACAWLKPIHPSPAPATTMASAARGSSQAVPRQAIC